MKTPSFWKAVLKAILGSVIVNLILLYVLRPFVIVPAAPLMALNPGPVAVLTAVGAIGAIVVYALMKKFLKSPERPFIWLSVVVFLVSLVPDFMLFSPNSPSFAGASVASVGTLMLMHAAAGVVIVWSLVCYWPAKGMPMGSVAA